MIWLMMLVASVLHGMAFAQSVVHEDFEDGSYHGDADSMKVQPKLMQEGGNTFLRITASRGDCDAIPSDYCAAGRNRSGITWTSAWNQMPLVTSANMRQTYSTRIRFVTTTGQTGSDGKFFSLSVYAPGGEGGYGTANGTGPNLSLWRGPVDMMRNLPKGSVGGYAPYNNERTATYFTVGSAPQNTWHTYTVKAVWSHDPRVGRMDIFLDGALRKTIAGRDIFLGPDSNRLPIFKTGHYGDYAYGQFDVDDIHVGPSDGSIPEIPPPEPPTPPETPPSSTPPVPVPPPPPVQTPLPPRPTLPTNLGPVSPAPPPPIITST